MSLSGGDLGGKKGVYLGINAKSYPLQQWRGFQPIEKVKKSVSSADNSESFSVDFSTGEILFGLPQYDPSVVRLERFALQSAARRLLPKSRTAKCLRFIRPGLRDVEVWRSSEHRTAHYAGLQVCSSVWACPVCAAKISERRRIELFQAMEKHKAEALGGRVLLLTLTNPHTATDDLQAMLKAQALAMTRFKSTKAAVKLWADIGCIGTVRAWEVTHGDNGWHPHFHILLFLKFNLNERGELLSFVSNDEMTARFYSLWANCCRLAKLPIPSQEHGVRLDDGDKASEYVSKGIWGLDREMTKGHLKKSKRGRSPFDLLRLYMIDCDKQSGALFCEYAAAFKGKRQLVWSKGLKSLFAIDEMTDEETAAQIEDDAVLLGNIAFNDWILILKYDLRGLILELGRHGWDAIERCLTGLRKIKELTN